jgi:predicted DNA-binding transcriptional regulator YafY
MNLPNYPLQIEMRNDILERQLNLMVLLTQNRNLSQEEISSMLEITPRTFYRYLEAFERMGFIVVKEGKFHRLDRSSPFFRKITELVHFTESEAVTMRNVLDSVGYHSPEIVHLREKLSRLYDHKILQHHAVNVSFANNLHQLYEAIKLERVAILHHYRSSRSNTVTNRTVEPFQFLSGNEEVRCYEPASGMCKTFKVDRLERVSVLDVKWSFREQHKTFYTDLFHFSGENKMKVVLRLDRLAAQLLLEEFPASEEELKNEGEHWILTTEVCSWKGVGRFVLGLPSNVEVLDSSEFLQYLQSQPHF